MASGDVWLGRVSYARRSRQSSSITAECFGATSARRLMTPSTPDLAWRPARCGARSTIWECAAPCAAASSRSRRYARHRRVAIAACRSAAKALVEVLAAEIVDEKSVGGLESIPSSSAPWRAMVQGRRRVPQSPRLAPRGV